MCSSLTVRWNRGVLSLSLTQSQPQPDPDPARHLGGYGRAGQSRASLAYLLCSSPQISYPSRTFHTIQGPVHERRGPIYLSHEIFLHMFTRISQLARQLSRPLPNYAHTSAAAATRGTASMAAAAVTADERNARTVNTAACLIIGDEVLGGKVCFCATGIEGTVANRA
jgi:hypothetical protein